MLASCRRAKNAGRPPGVSWYYDQCVADAARRQVSAEAKATGAASATEIMREIDKTSGDVRRTLTRRYMLEF